MFTNKLILDHIKSLNLIIETHYSV